MNVITHMSPPATFNISVSLLLSILLLPTSFLSHSARKLRAPELSQPGALREEGGFQGTRRADAIPRVASPRQVGGTGGETKDVRSPVRVHHEAATPGFLPRKGREPMAAGGARGAADRRGEPPLGAGPGSAARGAAAAAAAVALMSASAAAAAAGLGISCLLVAVFLHIES